ncbi:MAG: hypothetical protein L0215_18070 [Gemmataceae bacterium]|nr:hypothetical protein [Gemmataceae bacterium]
MPVRRFILNLKRRILSAGKFNAHSKALLEALASAQPVSQPARYDSFEKRSECATVGADSMSRVVMLDRLLHPEKSLLLNVFHIFRAESSAGK